MYNAGFQRNEKILRTEKIGDRFRVAEYDIWCPRILTGIGKKLADTTLSRSLIPEYDNPIWNEYKRKLLGFANDNQDVFKGVVIDFDIPYLTERTMLGQLYCGFQNCLKKIGIVYKNSIPSQKRGIQQNFQFPLYLPSL